MRNVDKFSLIFSQCPPKEAVADNHIIVPLFHHLNQLAFCLQVEIPWLFQALHLKEPGSRSHVCVPKTADFLPDFMGSCLLVFLLQFL